jgi:hypothetical protein
MALVRSTSERVIRTFKKAVLFRIVENTAVTGKFGLYGRKGGPDYPGIRITEE